MSSQYKENSFSTESSSASLAKGQNNMNKTAKPNIDYLIKRILIKRRQERKNTIAITTVCLSIILIFVYFQN
jgi:hypothetical protein